jgi:hypothetical protein
MCISSHFRKQMRFSLRVSEHALSTQFLNSPSKVNSRGTEDETRGCRPKAPTS